MIIFFAKRISPADVYEFRNISSIFVYMNYLLSLLPIALYLLILRALDSFSLAKWRILLACIAYGMLCCFGTFMFTRALNVPSWVAPVLEEVLKGLVVIFLLSGKKILFLHEALIYGAAAGAGFSLLENLIYLFFNPQMMAGTAIVRGFGCAILHMGCTALAGTLLLILDKAIRMLPISAIVSFVPSVIIHLAYNHAQESRLANPLLLMCVAVVLFLALFTILFSYGDKRIYKWMDHSLSVDIQTLSAIRKGVFTSTRAGQYLIAVRDQFKPECFFDMVCYVELFLDLRIEKQSYMLLCQTGFEGEAMGKTLEEHLAKKAELKSLKKSIGKTGMLVLAPLVA